MRVLPVKFQEAKEAASNFFIELYRIDLKSGELRFAACDKDITFNGEKYLAVPIERTEYRQSVDSKVDNLELRVGDVDHGIMLAIFGGCDFRGRDCEIIRIMYPESLEEGGEDLFLSVFTGELDAPYMNNKEFKATIVSKAPNQRVPNRKMQLSCNASFGDPEDCGVSKIVRSGTTMEDTTQSHIVDTVNRTEDNGFWNKGIVTIGFESRRVKRFEGGILYLDYPFIENPTGKHYIVEQGCDKTHKTCKERFNNGRNFSGFPSVPFEYVIKS